MTLNAEALQTASAKDRERVQALLDEARAIENNDVADARRILASIDLRIDQSGRKQAELELARVMQKRDVAYTKAIKATLTAYGITESDGLGLPIMPFGPAVHPRIKSPKVDWVVVCLDKSSVRVMQANGEAAAITPNSDDGAITIANGVTIVYPDNISSPEALAYLLYHERLHFDQFTTAGVGDRLGKEEREKEAWTKTRAAVAIIYANRDESAKSNALKHADKMIAESAPKAASEARMRTATFGLYNPAIHSPGAIRANADSLDTIEREADDQLRAAVEAARRAERLSRERAERAAREAAPPLIIAERPPLPRELEPAPVAVADRPPLPPGFDGTTPSGAAPAHKPDNSALLRGVAVEACSATGARSNGLLTYVYPGMNISSAGSERARLSGCELAVFDALTRYARGEYGNFTMSASWLAARAAEYRASVAPVRTQPSGPDCFRGGDPFGCQPR